MNPDAATLWRRPRSALAALLACLGMLGAFSIDTYIPAFSGIARSLDATPVQMQQTLSAYLFGFAVMNLFHGALADSFGRRPVVLWGIAIFTLSSLGCALSQTVGHLVFFRLAQGMSSGASMVVGARHHPRHVPARRGAARDVAGDDLLRRRAGRRAHRRRPAAGALRLALGLRLPHRRGRACCGRSAGACCPRRCTHTQVQPFHPAHLLKGYWEMVSSPRFLALALASGVPFNGMFLYILSAPVFLGDLLHLAPTHFFFLFLFTIGGIMGGAFLSGKLAGKMTPARQIRIGFTIMFTIATLNLVAQRAVHGAGLVGDPADRRLLVRLGADGAGRDAAGAGPGAAAARHGVVAAGLHRQRGQRVRGRRDLAARDAFHGAPGAGVAADVVHRHRGVVLRAQERAGATT